MWGGGGRDSKGRGCRKGGPCRSRIKSSLVESERKTGEGGRRWKPMEWKRRISRPKGNDKSIPPLPDWSRNSSSSSHSLLPNITWCIITPAKTWKMTPLRRLSIQVSLKFSLAWIQSRSRNMQLEEARAVWMFYWKLPDADLLMKVGWEGSLRQGEDLGHDALKGLVVTNKQI